MVLFHSFKPEIMKERVVLPLCGGMCGTFSGDVIHHCDLMLIVLCLRRRVPLTALTQPDHEYSKLTNCKRK